jgi:hypothetical protein
MLQKNAKRIAFAIAILFAGMIGFAVGDLLMTRRACSMLAVQIADSMDSKGFDQSCVENPYLGPGICERMAHEAKKFGVVKSYRIVEVAQGPLGLPTVVSVEVKRGSGTHREAIGTLRISWLMTIPEFF